MNQQGFYSLIQYVPDPERAEGANIGVVLYVPGPSPLVQVVFSERPPRLRLVCPSADFPSPARIRDLAQGFERRLKNDQPRDFEDFHKVLRKETGVLRAISPRGILVSEPQASAQDLCLRLVGEARVVERGQKRISQFEALLSEPGWSDRIRRGVDVPIPGKMIRAAYEWLNGKPNIVVPTSMSDEHRAIEQAYEWGAKGQTLLKRPVDNQERQLVLIPRISRAIPTKVVQDVRGVLGGFDVEMVTADGIDAYVDKVRRLAH